MKSTALPTCLFALLLGVPSAAFGAPVTVNGDPFTLVATGPGGTQLFGLTSDAQGRVYIGNNSNNTTGIPLQRFDPALFAGSPVALQSFGPAVGDADGLSFHDGFVYAADRDEGIRRTAVADGTSSLFIAGLAINGTGSPFVFRPSDGHLFLGLGGLTGIQQIREYTAAGAFVAIHPTGTDVETMTYDPASGLIYYAPFGTEVRALDPVTNVDVHVGTVSGFIDGGLAFDPHSGLLFVGTANGPNAGRVETIHPGSGVTQLFASGFNGALGILREPVSGDLYFLEATQLYRLPSAEVVVDGDLDGVPDGEDVCPGHDDLLDADGDGAPDGCDPCPADAADDPDGDGFCASDECDDADPATYPGALEVCDGKDNDCNGLCNEGVFDPETCATVQRGTFGQVEDTDIAAAYGSWAAGAHPTLATGFSPEPHRTLTRFDLSFIPEGSAVTSATASWYALWNAHHQTVRVHALLAPWSEATTSWANFSSTSNFDAAVLASFDGFEQGFKSVDLTDYIGAVVSGAAPDLGVLLESDMPPSNQGKAYYYVASESSNVARRPSLAVCWAAPCSSLCAP